MKKALSLLLTLCVLCLCCAASMVGCGEEEVQGSTLAHQLVREGYRIVSPLYDTDAERAAVTAIERTLLQTVPQQRIPVINDYIPVGTPIPQGAKEIIVGSTNRPTAQAALTALRASRPNSSRDFQILMGENEVKILAGSDAAIPAATAAFCAMLVADAATYPLSGYDSGIQRYDWPLTMLANDPIEQYTIVIPEGASEVTQTVASSLQQLLFEVCGYMLPMIDDTQMPSERELLVGVTNRPASQVAAQTLSSFRPNYANDGILFAQQGQIALVGGQEKALSQVLDALAPYLSDAAQSALRTVSIPIRNPNYPTVKIGAQDLGDYRIVYSQNAPFEIRLLAQRMADFFLVRCGYAVSVLTDEAPVDTEKMEILLGATNRTGAVTLADTAYALRTDAASNLLFDAGHYMGVVCMWNDILTSFADQLEAGATSLSMPTFSGVISNVALVADLDADLSWQMGEDTYKNSEMLPNFDFSRAYSLVWNEEFDGTSLEMEKWSLSVNASMPDTEFSDDESAISVSDGTLKLVARHKPDNYHTFIAPYSLSTHDTMNFSGGYLEMRAKLPMRGLGDYHSFWGSSHHAVLFKQAYRSTHNGLLYDGGYAVEVDFAEGHASGCDIIPNIQKWFNTYEQSMHPNMPDHVELSHFKDGLGKSDTTVYSFASQQQAQEFHTYGFLWTEQYMAFSIDGKFYYVYDYTAQDQAFSPTYRNKTGRDDTFDNMGLQKENMALSIVINNLVVSQTYASAMPWASGLGVAYEQYESVFPLTYTIDYMRLYQSQTDTFYTPATIGQGTLHYDSDRYSYALNGTG